VPGAIVLLLVGLAVTGSAAVWSLVLWRWQRGQPVLPRQDTAPPARSPLAVAVTLGWTGLALVSRLGASEPAMVPSLGQVQFNSLVSIGLLAILMLVLAHSSPRGLADFGVRTQRWPAQIGLGALTFLASILPVMAVLLATQAWRTRETQHPYLQALMSAEGWPLLAWIAWAVVVLAPLLEELMYRVILQSTCERFAPAWLAVVGVAVLFSAVHNPTDILPLIPLALLLGYVYHRTRSYLSVVTAHGLFNLANLLLALATSDASSRVEPPPIR
jgi:membrane protease YdiL (CAAX protease family)